MSESKDQYGIMARSDGESPEDVGAPTPDSGYSNTDAQIKHQQDLREAVAKSMTGPQYQTPDALREKLEQFAGEDASAAATTGAAGGGSVLATIGRWAPAAVAAMFLIAAVIIYQQSERDVIYGDGLAVLTSDRVDLMYNRHTECLHTLAALMQDPALPTELAELPDALATKWNVDAVMGLDLRPAGYRFAGVGKCSAPGGDAVHLIYKPTEGQADTGDLSLWVIPYNGQIDVEPGKVYQASVRGLPEALVFWRQGDMLYYVMGGTGDSVKYAVKTLRQQA